MLWGGVIASLLATFIPYDYVFIRQFGSIIGCDGFACFPIVQYLSFFIFGAIATRERRKVAISMSALSLLGFAMILSTKTIPNRFPPSLAWICFPQFMVWIYYCGSKEISDRQLIPKRLLPFVTFVGKHTIDYLLLSNIMLFTINCLQRHCILEKFSFIQSIVVGIMTILLITILIHVKNALANKTVRTV